MNRWVSRAVLGDQSGARGRGVEPLQELGHRHVGAAMMPLVDLMQEPGQHLFGLTPCRRRPAELTAAAGLRVARHGDDHLPDQKRRGPFNPQKWPLTCSFSGGR